MIHDMFQATVVARTFGWVIGGILGLAICAVAIVLGLAVGTVKIAIRAAR